MCRRSSACIDPVRSYDQFVDNNRCAQTSKVSRRASGRSEVLPGSLYYSSLTPRNSFAMESPIRTVVDGWNISYTQRVQRVTRKRMGLLKTYSGGRYDCHPAFSGLQCTNQLEVISSAAAGKHRYGFSALAAVGLFILTSVARLPFALASQPSRCSSLFPAADSVHFWITPSISMIGISHSVAGHGAGRTEPLTNHLGRRSAGSCATSWLAYAVLISIAETILPVLLLPVCCSSIDGDQAGGKP